MLHELRKALEARGLRPEANQQEVEEFYSRLSLEEKGKIGTEMAEAAYADGGLTQRDDPDRELTCRSFALRAESVNDEERSVEAVIATDQPVMVYDWRAGRTVLEVLRMDGAIIPEQVPLLDNHYRYSLDDVFGSVRQIKTATHEASGRLFFAENDERVERAWNKVRQRHLRDVSAGYRVIEATDIQPGETRMVGGRSYTARGQVLRISTRWELKEVSLVPIGADNRSKIRGQPIKEESRMNEKLRKYLESIGLRADASEAEALAFYRELQGDQRAEADKLFDGQRAAPPANEPPPAAPPPVEGRRSEPPADPAEIAQRALAAERDRVRQIRQLAGSDVPEELRTRAIEEGWDLNQASREFLSAVRSSRGQGAGFAIHSRSHDRDVNVRSLACGLMASVGIADPTQHTMYDGRRARREGARFSEQDAELGDRLRRMNAVDLCREAVLIDTGRYERDPEEAVRTAMSGATLAFVFGTSVYAKLMQGWAEIGDSTAGWCDEEDVANFLLQEDIDVSADANLEPHARGGTAADATFSDSHETYRIARYSKKFTADEMDFIDDRLGAILRVPIEMGRAARRVRPDLVYSILIENPALADGGALFNATATTTAGGHANLGTGALSSANLVAAINAMGIQRLNGVVLNIYPRFLVVPMALAFTGDVLLTTAALAQKGNTDATYLPANTADIDRIQRITGQRITIVVDDRIGLAGVRDPRTKAIRPGTATNWFLSAGGPRTMRVAYRRGTGRAPVMRSYNLDKGQWGMGWDINLDVGAAPMDYRGLYKSTGVA